ncbi:MAG: hypothetical protein LQ345_000015 [Seirophora villosa]|nr:MAG: hypothetical protein LQ345_000015 [Seirophora villosa]
MHHSRITWRSLCKSIIIEAQYQGTLEAEGEVAAPPPNLTLLDQDIAQPLLDQGSQGPSKKRRKVTRKSDKSHVDANRLQDDFLCLARVDISLIFAAQGDVREALPVGSCVPRPVVLEVAEEAQDSQSAFLCQIAATNGEVLFDATVSGSCSAQTRMILQRIVELPHVSRKKTASQVLCTLSQQTNCGETIGMSMLLCARILLPNNRELLEGSIFDRKLILDLGGVDVSTDLGHPWSPRDFYDSVFVPDKGRISSSFPSIDQLKCQLYPFQQRAIEWLLQREEGTVGFARPPALPHGFILTVDADGRPCFISPFLGTMTSHQDLVQGFSEVKGGILAEEMGLGKTVEMIGLICLHKWKSAFDSPPSRECSATLIITPPSILGQWKKEIQALAPDLKFTVYTGLRPHEPEDDATHFSRFHEHDIVLTTYSVLAREIHHSGHVPDRTFRNQKKYERRLSPLTQLKWWRVVLDEAQMIESGVSNAAKVAQLIPRHNAWCVSGTPVRKSSQDLRGLLLFLRLAPYCYSASIWDRLVVERRDVFRQIFRHLALRHTKDQIKDEIQLPPQRRVIITVPFTQIEEQNYLTLYNQMCEECGLDGDGNPLSEDWDPHASSTVEKMRSWLLRLRQTCLHAEVGIRNRKALGKGKGPLRTVNEVLEVMTEQNLTALRTEEKALLVSKARRGQMLEHVEQSRGALAIWSEALKEAQAIVSEARLRLQGENTEGDIGEVNPQINAPRQRLRSALELEHMLLFFTANAYYQIKSGQVEAPPGSAEYRALERHEEEHYEKAKTIRKEILVEARNKVDPLVKKLQEKASERSFAKIPDMAISTSRGGIESRNVLEKIDEVTGIIHKQVSRINEWREKATQLLSKPLVDEEETDLQGDEYEASTQQQDTVYSYVDALRAIVSDFHDIITGQRNTLIERDVKAALHQALAGGGHSPELLQELLSIRDMLKPPAGTGSVRGIITDLREIRTTLRTQLERGNVRAGAEIGIVNSTLAAVQSLSANLAKAAAALQREVELFTDVMNARLEFYRQLQQISDTVAPYEEDSDGQGIGTAMIRAMQTETRLCIKIATLKSTARYLEHLRREASDSDVNRLCIICQQNFEIGVLTSCGHSYCVECLRLWRRHHGTCPTCKKPLDQSDLHQITYKPQELTVREETHARDRRETTPSEEGSPSIYTDISASTLNEIKNIDMDVKQSFGTKIDSIARHIIWLRENDPGSKSVVFSQFKEFLTVLGTAFTSYKIGYARIDQKLGVQRFQDDPGIECLLMDAKSNSSGLTLVNATHVFLCEPLINTAIELQAVARVHRIGQHQPTTVWVYVVEDTVEKSIYDISVERRMAHVGKPGCRMASDRPGHPDVIEDQIEAANTLELETALGRLLSSGTSGGEMVDKEDLWSCLFRQKPVQVQPVSTAVEREVERHLRAAAADERRIS